MKNCISIFLFVSTCLFACNSKKTDAGENLHALKDTLMETDRMFSAFSEKKGMKNAFIDYMDSNAALLRPNHLPIVGANAVDYLIEQDDSDYTLTWEPQFAEAAHSGDLGYTYGVYQLKVKSKDTVIYGSYLSIWKKQKDGKWKFVLDTGNEGVESPDE